jgi:endogenous inhibitor of DNA gyrase (YacG/DUF329 family)
MNGDLLIQDLADTRFQLVKSSVATPVQQLWRLHDGKCPSCGHVLRIMPPYENQERFSEWLQKKKDGKQYHRLYCSKKCQAVIYAWDWSIPNYKDLPYCIESLA